MENLNQFLVSNIWILIAIVAWSLVWKGIALWMSARRSQYIWFLLILILNTLGILEIIYIFAVARRKPLTGTSGYGSKEVFSRKSV